MRKLVQLTDKTTKKASRLTPLMRTREDGVERIGVQSMVGLSRQDVMLLWDALVKSKTSKDMAKAASLPHRVVKDFLRQIDGAGIVSTNEEVMSDIESYLKHGRLMVEDDMEFEALEEAANDDEWNDEDGDGESIEGPSCGEKMGQFIRALNAWHRLSISSHSLSEDAERRLSDYLDEAMVNMNQEMKDLLYGRGVTEQSRKELESLTEEEVWFDGDEGEDVEEMEESDDVEDEDEDEDEYEDEDEDVDLISLVQDFAETKLEHDAQEVLKAYILLLLNGVPLKTMDEVWWEDDGEGLSVEGGSKLARSNVTFTMYNGDRVDALIVCDLSSYTIMAQLEVGQAAIRLPKEDLSGGGHRFLISVSNLLLSSRE